MKLIRKFALGARFAPRHHDALAGAEFAFEKLFSLLSAEHLSGMALYGGQIPEQTEAEEGYVAILMSDSLKVLRHAHKTLAANAEFMALLLDKKPFIENNYIKRLSGLTYYGEVRADGSIGDGDAPLNAHPKASKA